MAVVTTRILTESPVKRTMGAVTLSAIALLIRIGGNLVLVPLALHFLGKEQFGLFILFQSVAMYLTMAEFGVGQSVVNFQGMAFARGDYEGVNRILATTFGINFLTVVPLWLLCSAAIFLLPSDRWLLSEVPSTLVGSFKPYIFLTTTLALAKIPLQVIPTTLLGVREAHLRQLTDVVLAGGVLLGSIAVLVSGGGLLLLLVVTFLVPIVVMLGTYTVVRSRHPQIRLESKFWTSSLVQSLVANSLFFFLYNLGLFSQRLGGNVLAGKLLSLSEVPAIYVILMLFRVVGWSLAEILSQAVQPYYILFSQEGQKERLLLLARLCTKLTFVLAVVYASAVLFFAELGIRMWLGPGMFVGFGPLVCVIISYLMEVLFLSTNNFMRGLNQHRGLAVIMAAYGVLSFVLGFAGARSMPLTPALGLCFGLAIASFLAQALLLPPVTRQWLGLSWGEYARDFLFRPLTVAGIAFGILALPIPHSGLVPSATFFTCFLALLGGFSWYVVLDGDERAWAFRLVKEFRSMGTFPMRPSLT